MPTPGETICGEILLQRLASSSLGAEVFQPVFVARAQGQGPGDELWLTVVDAEFTSTSVGMSTFMAGANALCSLRHPALVRVVLVDREESYCVVGYEALPGAESLHDVVVAGDGRKLLARTAVEVARGLAYLHRRDLLHGALTPATVVLWEDTPMLWEHGLAGLCDPTVFGPRARTMGGDVVAPEVPTGAPLSPAVDVFAWGAVMAAVASGELGSDGVAAVLEGDVEPGRDGPLLGVIRQALAPEPERRPRDGLHLLELLQRALGDDRGTEADADEGPATAAAGAGSRDAGRRGLQDLAGKYLQEMAQVHADGSDDHAAGSKPAAPPGLAPPPGLAAPRVGARPAAPSKGSAVPPKPPKVGGFSARVATPPHIEDEDRMISPPSIDDDPPPKPPSIADWGYKMPPSAIEAVREAAPSQGLGLVRGPQPGVSGSDAGQLGSVAPLVDAVPRARVPEPPSASGWLRPAPPRAPDGGLGGLFDPTIGLRELPDGVRKRAVLQPGSVESGPTEGAVPRVVFEADDTPPDATPLHDEPVDPFADAELGELDGAPVPIDDDVGPSDAPAFGPRDRRDDGPSRSGRRARDLLDEVLMPALDDGGPPALSPDEVPTPDENAHHVDDEDEDDEDRSEPVDDELPPMPEPIAGTSSPERARPKAAAPFRMPRSPGPHGPPARVMTIALAALAGVLAVGATLAAVSARGGVGALLRGEAPASTASTEADGPPPAVAPLPEGPCPPEMVHIEVEHADGAPPRRGEPSASFCIDRAEYPGLDRVPATEVDLPHARKACEARSHALCTEAQWRRACRGDAGWPLPYGPAREAGRCRVGHSGGTPGPAGADPGCVTPEGVLDLVGNVSEWTEEAIVMGGHVRSPKSTDCDARRRVTPKTKQATLGFRCCAPVPEDGAVQAGEGGADEPAD